MITPVNNTVEDYYVRYTEKDHEVWAMLMSRSNFLLSRASMEFLEGLKQVKFSQTHIPRLSDINDRLLQATGWRYQPTTGAVSNLEFFEALYNQTFLFAVDIRPQEELNFCKLPDVFHDMFGHAALLCNDQFCVFLKELGAICRRATHADAVAILSRMYWYTAEVGLIKENGETRYYGGSIISSATEIGNVFDNKDTRIYPFSVEGIIDTPYDSYHVNSQYFTIDSMNQLNECLPLLREKLCQS
jgi:phenylalanine-4-hydroxylase